MKGMKEYLVLFAVIAALVAYIALKGSDRMHYRIPAMKPLDQQSITKVEIRAKGRSVTVSKKDNAWLIGSEGFPAETARMEKMLRAISGLRLTDLVSQSENYSRYDLGENEKITVKAYAGTREVRVFDVGKVAPSFRHTYVMLPGDKHVYQAEDSFRDDFDLDAAALRDKKVLSFVMDEIGKIRIEKGGTSFTITRENGQAKAEGTDGAAKTGWVDERGREIPKTDVDLFMFPLSSLECSTFLDGRSKGSMGKPEATITFIGKKDYSFSFYKKEGTEYPATSSGSAYVFALQENRLDDLLKSIAKLLGGK